MTDDRSSALRVAKDDAIYCCAMATSNLRNDNLDNAMYWLTQAVYEVAKAQRFRTDEREGTA